MMRTGTGRRAGSSRSVTFRKPLGSATGHLQDPAPDCVAIRIDTGCLGFLAHGLHCREVAWQYSYEFGCHDIEVVQHPLSQWRLGTLGVLGEQAAQYFEIRTVEISELQFSAFLRLLVDVLGTQRVNVRHAAGHPGAEVASGGSQNHGDTTGHVLQGVVADSFDDRARAGVSHQEAFPYDPGDEHRTRSRAVADDVSSDHILVRGIGRAARWTNDDIASGQTLSHVVIRVAFESEYDSCGQERAERLSGGAVQGHIDRLARQPFSAEPGSHLVTEHRAHGAFGVTNRQLGHDRSLLLESILRHRDELNIEVLIEFVLLRVSTPTGLGCRELRSFQDW